MKEQSGEQITGERMEAENKLSPEQKYERVQAALDGMESIMKEIREVLDTAPDRKRAEILVLERFGPQVEKNKKELDEALKDWFAHIAEARQKEVMN